MMCPDHPDIISAMETGYGRGHTETRPVFLCSECGETIYEGDEYYDIFGEQICEDCIIALVRTAEVAE